MLRGDCRLAIVRGSTNDIKEVMRMFKNIKAIVLPLKKEEKTTAQVCAQRSQCRVTHKRKDC
jgi:hypothetical protein